MELIAEGTYEGVTKSAVLYESKGNALMCVFDVEVEHRILKAWITLVQKDGTLSERGLKNVQEIMDWPTWNWEAFDADPVTTFGGRAVSAVIEISEDQNDNAVNKIKWLNAQGGGIQKADAKAMMAKYGAKFRAICGGAPASTKTSKMEQPNLPKRHAAPLSADETKSTQEACWEKLCKVMSGKPPATVEAAWFRLVDKIGSGKDQKDMTPAEWGKAMALIASVQPATVPDPTPLPPPPDPDEDNLPF